MLVHPGSGPAFVVSVCGVQVSSFTDRSVQGRSLATEKKYVFIIKEMGKISKALVTFYGTLNCQERPGLSVRNKKWPNFKQALVRMRANDSDSILQSLRWPGKLLSTSNYKPSSLLEPSIAAVNGIYFIS